MEDCVFCNIVDRKLPVGILYEDETIVAFKDINPKASTHILVITKKHIPSLSACSDANLLGAILLRVKLLASSMGLTERGYRVVINSGNDAGQEINHLHAHLLGGRKFRWPPG